VKRFLSHRCWQLLFLFAVLTLAAAGCSTVEKEPENSSARPWDQPKGWEGGMPGGSQQYR
jgi:hypothetical protein